MPKYRARFRGGDGSDERRNSLGLDGARLNRLLDILDEKAGEAPLKRVHVRWPFRCESITFRLIEGFGSRREFKVAARNLSNSGLSVIHNAYVHPGTECEVVLSLNERFDHSLQTIRGKVCRCQHIQGVVHEVGVAFEEHIDAREYLALDSMPAYYSLETIEPDKIEGTVLHVEDSALDRRLFAHYLADTRVIIKSAETIDDAKRKLAESFDLVMLDFQLPDGSGAELVTWMRDMGLMIPVIALTADSSRATQKLLTSCEISGYLTKPVDAGTLQRAMTEYLRLSDAGATAASSSDMRELAGTFINELGSIMDDLRTCREKDDAMTAYSIVLRLKGTAPALGFQQLANVCDRAAAALASSMSFAESQRQLDALMDACDRVKHRRAG